MPDIAENNAPLTQAKMFILFSVTDDARFLSHRETQTIWQRAFLRANIPVCFTQGFNPRIKLSLPLPRNVGVASECELLVFYLNSSLTDQQIAKSLSGQLPVGINYIRSGSLEYKQKVTPYQVSYLITPHPHVELHKLSDMIKQLNVSDEYLAHRSQRGRHKARSIDIKNNIKELSLRDKAIKLTMTLETGVTARLDEIVHALGLDIAKDIQYISRIDTQYHEINNSHFSIS